MGLLHSRMDRSRLKKMVRKKLRSVSYRVTPVWKKMAPLSVMDRKQRTIREGELKIKSSTAPVAAPSSQRARNRIKIMARSMVTCRLCSSSRSR